MRCCEAPGCNRHIHPDAHGNTHYCERCREEIRVQRWLDWLDRDERDPERWTKLDWKDRDLLSHDAGFIAAERGRVDRETLNGAEAVEVALRNGVVGLCGQHAEMSPEERLAYAADEAYKRLEPGKRYKVTRDMQERLDRENPEAA